VAVAEAKALADRLANPPTPAKPAPAVSYSRLARLVLTDTVGRTLFGEYAAHRAGDRGQEETGWVLLGRREEQQAVVLATLPAGAERDAGEAHVRFNADAQAVASRIVRRHDRRLTMLGVVHTHPGRLRHPSRGDFDGDRRWVPAVRGREGVFGIGTAGGGTDGHPAPNVQGWEGLRFDWYALAADDPAYRPLPVELVHGPDQAADLRACWPVIEAHAGRLDRLARQLPALRLAPADGGELMMTLPLATPGHTIRVMAGAKAVRLYFEAAGDVFQPDLPAGVAPDQAVYLLLAELAARS
jgi:proteasome lid subunit RPN8/RPN11